MNKLTLDLIKDGSKSWYDILDIDFKDPNPCHIRRINNFIKQEYPDKIKGKSIDLATLLLILRHRNCFIKIPYYEDTTKYKIKNNQLDAGGIRRGKIISLVSNQYTFNFSITIANEKYIELDDKKCDAPPPRTYTLTNEQGDLLDNWKKFEFDITDKERDFFNNIIDSDGNIDCDRFVNTSLAQAFFSEYYMLIKCLIIRLVAERSYLNKTKKKFLAQLPPSGSVLNESGPYNPEDKDKYESYPELCFEARISNFDENSISEFSYISDKLDPKTGLDICNDSLEGLINLTAEYKFMARLIELAFTKLNPYSETMDPVKFSNYNRNDCKWNEQTVKLPRGRIDWFELMFKSYSILCRYYTKKIQRKITKD